MLEENLETIHYPSFMDLNKLKVSLPREEKSQMEKKKVLLDATQLN